MAEFIESNGDLSNIDKIQVIERQDEKKYYYDREIMDEKHEIIIILSLRQTPDPLLDHRKYAGASQLSGTAALAYIHSFRQAGR